MDEIAEFNRGTLEALRQPIEDGVVHVTRVDASLTFPCNFTLVAAMNPCPCGYFGTDRCDCKPAVVSKYLQKLSGPIVDRIDLQVELRSLSVEERFAKTSDGESLKIRRRVELARERQHQRYDGTGIPFNAAMPGGHVADYCEFSENGFSHFKTLIDSNSLSTRSMDRLAKVARTIADLEDNDAVEENHLDEAARFVIGGVLRYRT